MVSYKELGLVNTREMFAKAIKGGYAIPAFNFNNMEQMQAIISACVEASSPVILQVSSGARKYANQTLLRYMAQGAVEYAKELGKNIPICLHLDHGNSFELCKSCIDMGFSSVMIDGSHLPYDENVALTKQVVDYAHQFDVTVEGELGVLAGVEDEVSAEHHTYTRPEDVEDFVKKTGVDSLAISIGTSHGANKFKPEQCTRNAEGILVPPELRFGYTDSLDFGSKRDAEMYLGRFLLVNIDEFDQVSIHQQGFLKHLLQKPVANLRKPYGSSIQEMRRYASFIGTSNHKDLLTDSSGSRRFFCVEVTAPIDTNVTINYRQLYAQAMQAIRSGERYWFDDTDEAILKETNREFEQISPIEQLFHSYFRLPEEEEKGEWMSPVQILEYLHTKSSDIKLTDGYAKHFGRVLKKNHLQSKHTNKGVIYQIVKT